MVLLIDNYDSFVHNLARYVEELGCATRVVRNDAIDVAGILALAPAAVILSPGPCTPAEAGVCLDVVRRIGPTVPLLGVCLGHQAIGQALRGRVVRAPHPVHGQTSTVTHDGSRLFAGQPRTFQATRYHSLHVEGESLPAELRVTAVSDDGLVMSIEHRTWPVFGVQFHPESILTEGGHRLLGNFLSLAGLKIGSIPGRELILPAAEFDLPEGGTPPLTPLHY